MATYCGFQGALAGASGVSGVSIQALELQPDAAKAVLCLPGLLWLLVSYMPLAPRYGKKTPTRPLRSLSGTQ